MNLAMEWFLFLDEDGNEASEWTVSIEYNLFSSLINTMLRDFAHFPFAFVMSIYFGMMSEMYQLKGVDHINFYIVTQFILMGVSCADLLPINDHWKWVFIQYRNHKINAHNVLPLLMEFLLPYIYFSSCIFLLFVGAHLLRWIAKKAMRISALCLIPWIL